MMPVLANILLAAPPPIRIITGQEPSAVPAPGPDYFAWASVICILAAVCLVLWRRHKQNQKPPEIRAFEMLARKLSITVAERGLLEKMSVIHGQISPLAMLASPSAFARCRESMDVRTIGGNQAAMAALARKLS